MYTRSLTFRRCHCQFRHTTWSNSRPSLHPVHLGCDYRTWTCKTQPLCHTRNVGDWNDGVNEEVRVCIGAILFVD